MYGPQENKMARMVLPLKYSQCGGRHLRIDVTLEVDRVLQVQRGGLT